MPSKANKKERDSILYAPGKRKVFNQRDASAEIMIQYLSFQSQKCKTFIERYRIHNILNTITGN